MSWMLGMCAAIAAVAAIVAAFTLDERRAVISLWIAGIATGGVYLALGAELLAIVQWMIATLSAIALRLSAGLFGESGSKPRRFQWLLPAIGGISLFMLIAIAVRDGGGADAANPPAGQRTADLGHLLLGDHFVSLEILGLCLFISIIGAGVISRPDTGGGSRETAP